MNNMISLLLPTRGRPFLVKRLFASLKTYTDDLNRIEIVLGLDEDDPASHFIDDNRLNIKRIFFSKSNMGEYNTRCMQHAAGDILMLVNDDLTFCTSGWDRIIRHFVIKTPDRILMAYPDDMEKANLSTFPILTRESCEVLKDPYPQVYESLFIDDHLFDIFIRLANLGQNRLFYLNNIKLDHRHFVDGKIRPDASYTHKNRYKDYITFISLINLRQICACRLLAAIKGTTLPDLPSSVFLLPPPRNIADAVYNYSAKFLMDNGLPLRRRLLWFIRFTKYFIAMKGGINFLKAKTYTLYGS